MVQLSLSMMERYEIENRRPGALRAALFGADQRMLGVAARLLDAANERGGDLGALCVDPAAAALRNQDGMFTLLVRGEAEDGSPIREERVVQSIIDALDPEGEFDRLLELAGREELNLLFISGGCTPVETALLARFLYARWEAGLGAPDVLVVEEHPLPEDGENLRACVRALSGGWTRGEAFERWLAEAPFQLLLAESLSGPLADAERVQREMNYRDDFIAWAEPQLRCTPQLHAPEALADVLEAEDFALACARRERIFDALVFLCAPVGFLCGMHTFAETLRDEKLRAWIGRAFFEELLPALPWSREESAPWVISAFNRLENPMNDMPLLEIGLGLLKHFSRTILPAVRSWAEREFEAPKRLSLALSAAVMLYAGARRGDDGAFEVQRGEERFRLRDDEAILEAFSRLAHDVPSETLAYAVLADRDLWGADLREIDGLELAVACDLSAIQRAGLRETLRLTEGE